MAKAEKLVVEVVAAHNLMPKDGQGSSSAYVEVEFEHQKRRTRPRPRELNPVWNERLVFPVADPDDLPYRAIDVGVYNDRAASASGNSPHGRNFLGKVRVPAAGVPAPGEPVVPQLFTLEKRSLFSHIRGRRGLRRGVALQGRRRPGPRPPGIHQVQGVRAPKLWYLRVSVIEAQALLPVDKGPMAMGRYPELFVRAQIGSQMLRTRASPIMANRGPTSPFWNEDLMFVVAEPFEEFLVVSLEDHVSPGRDDILGRLVVPVTAIERRWDEKLVVSRWFGLDRGNGGGNVPANNPNNRFGSRVHLRLSLDGGYHVLDEATAYSSDLRPTAKQLWYPHVGVLELGVLGATGLIPMKGRADGRGATADSYCVAKYGQKWIRTRTVVDSVCPRWNEQYTWEVFDPCTVITVGVFDNCHVDKPASGSNTAVAVRDNCIGKVRIRLSTLETDRVYTHAYPLLMLHPSGVKKMGELHLAVRFCSSNAGNMYHAYARPMLPKMHYVEPLLVRQGGGMQAVLSWRDPRATMLFSVACVAAAVIAYAVPMKLLVGLWGLYAMRPPRFRSRMPSPLMNFFRRLPSKADILL
uniref:C2 domain-containing protein n=1 Tax=Aegilops tauschii TaxID=37682 RepID=N1QQK9_AEGTA